MSGLFCVIMFRTRDCVPCAALQLFLLTLTVLRTPRQSRGIFFNVESSRVCRNVLNFRLFRYPLEYDAQAAPKPPNSIPKIRKKLRQHRIIPALRLKHRSGSCGTASALPKCSIMSGCGTRIVLRFAVSATGGAHLCSIQYYLRFWLGICRTSLAVSALRIMRYCPNHHSVIFVLPLGQKGFILVYEW